MFLSESPRRPTCIFSCTTEKKLKNTLGCVIMSRLEDYATGRAIGRCTSNNCQDASRLGNKGRSQYHPQLTGTYVTLQNNLFFFHLDYWDCCRYFPVVLNPTMHNCHFENKSVCLRHVLPPSSGHSGNHCRCSGTLRYSPAHLGHPKPAAVRFTNPHFYRPATYASHLSSPPLPSNSPLAASAGCSAKRLASFRNRRRRCACHFLWRYDTVGK